jgi:hypothetical protein
MSNLNKISHDCKLSETTKRCAGCETGLTNILEEIRPQIESNESLDSCMQLLKAQFQSSMHVFGGNLRHSI